MEAWKDVIGFEGWYEISSIGRAKRAKAGHTTYAGRILKPFRNGRGHPSVVLSKNGKRKLVCVHTLVLEAFAGPRPSYKHVCHHKNGDKTDNRLENLEWVTISKHRRVLHPFNTWA